MAHRYRLTPRHAALAVAAALALLLHAGAWVVIEPWLQPSAPQQALATLRAPIYSRVITPTAPPPAPATTAPTPPGARASLAGTRPAPATRVISAAEAASAPNSDAANRIPARASAEDATTPSTSTVAQGPASPSAPGSASDAPGPAEATSTPESPAATAAAATAATATAATAATAADTRWPTDTRLSYRLEGFYRGPIDGDAQVTWQREGDRYQVQVAIRMAVFIRITLTSQGRIVGDRLLPTVYQEQMPTRTRSVRLDEREVMLGNGKLLPRPDDVQDTASQFVALAQRFARGQQRLAEGEVVPLWMARPGGVDEWAYEVRAPVMLDTPRWGAVQAWPLVPRAMPPSVRSGLSAQIWFAPTLQHLPARIRLTLGEEAWLDLRIDRIEQAAR